MDLAESPARPGGANPDNGSFCAPAARRSVLLAAILASSMGFIDGTVVSLAMPAIRADLGASLADAQWISNSYMLFLSSLVLLGGAAGDVYGVRNIFAAGIALFMATSLACALATSADMLILMRGAQGMGAALMVPGSLAILAKTYPPETRGHAIGQWAAFSSLTTAAGPFIGGMMLSLGGDWLWRLIFAINVPIGILTLGLLFARVPADRPSRRRRLDVPGAILATAGLGLIAWGLTSLGIAAEARRVPAGAWISAGALVFCAFVLWERRTPEPMVRLGLFRARAFAGANLYTLVLFLGFVSVVFFLPMTVISGWRVPEWQASLLSIPLSLLIALYSGRAGRVADRIGPRLPLTAGALVMAVSYAGLALTMPLMRFWDVTFPIVLLQGVGMALLVSPLSTAVMTAVGDEDTGLASGVNNAVARAAGLMAVAALGALGGVVFTQVFGARSAEAEFGALPAVALEPAAEALRVAATNAAFQSIAAIASLMCLAAAGIAWATQPSWRRPE